MSAAGVAFVESLIDAGGAIGGWSQLFQTARLPVALVLCGLAGWVWRMGNRGDSRLLLAAMGLGWVAQSYLSEDAWVVGVGVYGLAIASGWLWQPPEALNTGGWRAPMALGAIAGALVVVVVWGLVVYRIDVYPQLYYDEVAYLKAAQMGLGEIEPGSIFRFGGRGVYSFEQFLAQTVPFLLQTAAVGLAEPSVVPLRFLSSVAAALAVAVGMLALRRHTGGAVVLAMGVLAAFSPLALLYARTGLYIEITILHAALCFGAMLWCHERWSTASGLVLGALLGGSLYFYQLSWFTGVFAVVAVAVSPELHRRDGALRMGALVAGMAIVVALPGAIALREGLRDVNAQTFDRAVWTEVDGGRTRVALLVPPADEVELGSAGQTLPPELTAALEGAVELREERSVRGGPVWIVEGESGGAEKLLAAAEDLGWQVFDDPWVLDTVWERVLAVVSRLVFAPSPESAGRWVSGPLLNPILTPVLVVGLLVAVRRWREWPMRLLVIWVVGAALLPAVVGGVVPRRVVLLVPFVYATAALPLIAWLRGQSGPARSIAVAAVVLWLGVVSATNAYAYFRTWDERIADHPSAPQILEVVKLLRELPEDEVVLLPQLFKSYQLALVEEAELGGQVNWIVENRTGSAEGFRKASCARQTPFSWLTVDAPREREKLRVLERDFLVRSEAVRGYRLLRVSVRKRYGCLDARGVSSKR